MDFFGCNHLQSAIYKVPGLSSFAMSLIINSFNDIGQKILRSMVFMFHVPLREWRAMRMLACLPPNNVRMMMKRDLLFPNRLLLGSLQNVKAMPTWVVMCNQWGKTQPPLSILMKKVEIHGWSIPRIKKRLSFGFLDNVTWTNRKTRGVTNQIISKVYKIVQVCNNKKLQAELQPKMHHYDSLRQFFLLLLQALVGDLGFQVPEPAKHYGAAWGAQRVVVPTFVQFGQSKPSDAQKEQV